MLKIYLSHPIRGPLKDKATAEDMRRNCEDAKVMADLIRSYMPVTIDLYLPAEHEGFVSRAWELGMLTARQILDIDCRIIEEEYNDLLLVYAPYGYPVAGCHTEMVHAKLNNIPVVIFENIKELDKIMTGFLKDRGLI